MASRISASRAGASDPAVRSIAAIASRSSAIAASASSSAFVPGEEDVALVVDHPGEQTDRAVGERGEIRVAPRGRARRRLVVPALEVLDEGGGEQVAAGREVVGKHAEGAAGFLDDLPGGEPADAPAGDQGEGRVEQSRAGGGSASAPRLIRSSEFFRYISHLERFLRAVEGVANPSSPIWYVCTNSTNVRNGRPRMVRLRLTLLVGSWHSRAARSRPRSWPSHPTPTTSARTRTSS